MMKKTIVITGANGFIGSNLCRVLKKDYKIIGIDRHDTNHPKGIKFYCQDINYDLPDIKNVYAVIHLAAKAGVRDSMESFDQYVHDNVLGTKNILDKCAEDWKPKILLVASSSSVYGDRNGNEYHPKSPYAASKVMTEQLVETYRNNNMLHDTDAICMRIFTVFGPGQREDLAIRKFISAALEDKEITIYGDGTQKRDFTYIDDLCAGINELLEAYRYCDDDCVDMGTGSPVSINHILYMLSRIMNKPLKIKYEDWNQFDVYETCSEDMYCKLNTSLEDGLKEQIKWQKTLI